MPYINLLNILLNSIFRATLWNAGYGEGEVPWSVPTVLIPGNSGDTHRNFDSFGLRHVSPELRLKIYKPLLRFQRTLVSLLNIPMEIIT